MAELAALARPYSEAAFKFAEEKDQVGQWSEMLGFLKEVASNDLVKKLADNPRVSKATLEETLNEICKEQVSSEGMNFVKLLVKNDRLAIAGVIADQYEVKKAEKEGAVDVSVISAYEMSDDAQSALSESLTKTLGRQVSLSVEVDESLIGGVIIRAGDKVIDRSVSGQIQQLAKQLK